jgi:hypothetical protein
MDQDHRFSGLCDLGKPANNGVHYLDKEKEQVPILSNTAMLLSPTGKGNTT